MAPRRGASALHFTAVRNNGDAHQRDRLSRALRRAADLVRGTWIGRGAISRGSPIPVPWIIKTGWCLGTTAGALLTCVLLSAQVGATVLSGRAAGHLETRPSEDPVHSARRLSRATAGRATLGLRCAAPCAAGRAAMRAARHGHGPVPALHLQTGMNVPIISPPRLTVPRETLQR